MPRVPNTPSVAQRPVGAPRVTANTDGVFGEQIGQGLQQAGAGIGRAADAADAIFQRAKQKAQTAKIADLESQYQKDIDSTLVGNSEGAADGPGMMGQVSAQLGERQPGYLQRRGEDAVAASSDTLSKMQKRRQELAESAADPDVKQLFLARSNAMYEGARMRVEGHVGQQIELQQVAAMKNRADAALSAIATDFDNPTLRDLHLIAPEGPIRALQLNREDGDAKLNAFRAQAAQVVLNGYLDRHDTAGARRYLDAPLLSKGESPTVRQVLGDAAGKYQKAIDGEAQDIEAEKSAMALTTVATDPDTGKFDEAQARAAFDSMYPPGPLRDKVAQRLEHRINVMSAGWKRTVGERVDSASSALEQRHSLADIRPLDKQWLKDNAPDEWHQLELRAQALDAHSRAKREGKKTPKTDEQRSAMLEFRDAIVTRPSAFTDIDDKEFSRQWQGKLAVDDLEEAGRIWAATKKGGRESMSAFSAFISNEVNSTPALKGKKVSKQFAADMGDRWREFIAVNKRAPTVEEMKPFSAAVQREYLVEGRIYGHNKVPHYQLTPEQKRDPNVKPAEDDEADPGTPDIPVVPPPKTIEDAAPKSRSARIAELKNQGKTAAQILQTMQAEGYK